jgi:hypothetical protein
MFAMNAVTRILTFSAIVMGAIALSLVSAQAQDPALTASRNKPFAEVPPTRFTPVGANGRVVVAQQCIARGQTCTINGTPCCPGAGECTGKFPYTYCQ